MFGIIREKLVPKVGRNAIFKMSSKRTGSIQQSRRICTHLLLPGHQNHDQVLNTIHRKTLEPTKNRYPTSKDKEKATVKQQEGHDHNTIKSYAHRVGRPQTGEQ